MSPLRTHRIWVDIGFPRSRGDEPATVWLVSVSGEFSPLTRG